MIKSNFFIRNRKRIILVIVVMIIFIVLWYFGVGKRRNVKANVEMKEEYATVTKGNIELTVTGSGAIESSSTKNIATEVSAKVKTVNVAVGDKVKKGDVLFELEKEI